MHDIVLSSLLQVPNHCSAFRSFFVGPISSFHRSTGRNEEDCHSDQHCWDRHHYTWRHICYWLWKSERKQVNISAEFLIELNLNFLSINTSLPCMHCSSACRYVESSRMSSLEEVWVSKASARQRQGRAGRVRSGVCFRLYTKDRCVRVLLERRSCFVNEIDSWKTIFRYCSSRFSSFKQYSQPEILRVPLEELCLHILVRSCLGWSEHHWLGSHCGEQEGYCCRNARWVNQEISSPVCSTLPSGHPSLAPWPSCERLALLVLCLTSPTRMTSR